MLFSTFQSALMRSLAGPAIGFTSGLTAGLATNNLWLAGAGAAVGLVTGALTFESIWHSNCDDADRLNRLVEGQPQRRVIAVNRPDTPHSRITSVDAPTGTARLHYFEAGQEFQANGTLLLIHGFGSNAYQWNQVFDELAERHHVIAIDLPGHGYSSCLEGHDYDFIAIIRPLLINFMEQKGLERVTLIGSSMGGDVSQLLAPNNDRVERVLLFSSSGCSDQIEDVAWFVNGAITAPKAQFLLRYLPSLERLTTRITLWSEVHPTAATFGNHDVDEFSRPYIADPEKVTARSVYASMIHKLSTDLVPQQAFLMLQSQVTQPVLSVSVESDTLIPRSVPKTIQRNIPHSSVLWIPRDVVPSAGHTLMSDNPALFLRIVDDFLEERALQPSDTDKRGYMLFRNPESREYEYLEGFQFEAE